MEGEEKIEWTLLIKTSYHGHKKLIQLLFEYDAQVDMQDYDGWSALMAGSENGQTEVVKLLHEYSAQLDLQDNDWWTAMMVASQNGQFEVVKLLSVADLGGVQEFPWNPPFSWLLIYNNTKLIILC